MAAQNVGRIRVVDTTSDGLFLFNHFAADDREVMLELCIVPRVGGIEISSTAARSLLLFDPWLVSSRCSPGP
jgi:hypothetical protein